MTDEPGQQIREDRSWRRNGRRKSYGFCGRSFRSGRRLRLTRCSARTGRLAGQPAGGLVTFTEREDRACEVTDALARWLLEEHLSLDDEADPGVQVDCPICGGPVRYDSPQQAELEIRGLKTRRGKIEYERAARRCGRCRKVFFPLDDRLKLGTEGYSPRLLEKIEYAGTNEGSFGQAGAALGVLGELPISAKHVQRITERLGEERRQQRDAQVSAMKAGTLKPMYPHPPQVAAIHLDAGKIQLREDDGQPGIRDPHWHDSKVGCFQTYSARSDDTDPQPRPPAVFLNPPRVMRLCQQMARVRSRSPTRALQSVEGSPTLLVEEEAAVDRPARLVRTAVATLEPTEPFGWMVSAEATRRGFYEASKKAVVGDGGNWIGPLVEMHFPGWVSATGGLDFLHLLVHLYAAATAAYRGHAKAARRLYERLVCRAWAGPPLAERN